MKSTREPIKLDKNHPDYEKCTVPVGGSVRKRTHDAFVAEVNKRGLSHNMVLNALIEAWVLRLRM